MTVLVSVILGTPGAIHAQGSRPGGLDGGDSGSIRGRVLDPSLNPIAGASIVVGDGVVSGSSGADGWFEIDGVPAGGHTIGIERQGFFPHRRYRMLVRGGSEASAHFILIPIPAGMAAPITECDLEAAHPFDPDRAGPGRFVARASWLALPNAEVRNACSRAMRSFPQHAERYQFQTWRFGSGTIPGLERLAEGGSVPARYALIDLYLALDRAGDAYEVAERLVSDLDDPVGYLTLAEGGLVAGTAPEQVAELAGIAAEAGNSGGEFLLGRLYLEGNGVPANPERGAELVRRAAAKGHPAAQTVLGLLYESGDVLEKNDAVAMAWFANAVEHPVWGMLQTTASASLGFGLTEGRGVSPDLSGGLDHLYWAALNGTRELPFEATPLPPRVERAASYFAVKAAESGDEQRIAQGQAALRYLERAGGETRANALQLYEFLFDRPMYPGQRISEEALQAMTIMGLVGIAVLLAADGSESGGLSERPWETPLTRIDPFSPREPEFWEHQVILMGTGRQ